MLNEIDLSRVDLNLLSLFEVVFQEGHVGRAATRLHLSASAVSHSLGRLRRLLHDPLFLRHPKGVVPTERAEALVGPIAEILGQVRRVVAGAEPFDPARSRRRFTIGMPDGIAAVVLPPLLAEIRRAAPGVDVRVRQLMPAGAPAALDAREVDVAVVPLDNIPARFAAPVLYEEDFVVAMRAGHPLGPNPSLEEYCAAQHLVVAADGKPRGFVDAVLERQGLSRRVVLTVPGFLLAYAVAAETDLVATMPRRHMRMHGARFGVVSADLPAPLRRICVRAVAPRAAMADAGLAWLMVLLEATPQRAPESAAAPTGRLRARAAAPSQRAPKPRPV
jgi:DNA-binding transcriptional LysR family regulator